MILEKLCCRKENTMVLLSMNHNLWPQQDEASFLFLNPWPLLWKTSSITATRTAIILNWENWKRVLFFNPWPLIGIFSSITTKLLRNNCLLRMNLINLNCKTILNYIFLEILVHNHLPWQHNIIPLIESLCENIQMMYGGWILLKMT